MWDTINQLGQNPAVLLLIAGIIILGFYCIKKGYFKFEGKGVKLGMNEQQTRDLIRAQWDFVTAKCEGMTAMIPIKEEGLDIYRTKHIIDCVKDVLQSAVIFNSITDNEAYVKGKQELVYQIIMARIDKDYFKTPEFKAFVYKFVDELFHELYRMKKVYRQGQ